MTEIFLGNPPEHIKRWIEEHSAEPTVGGVWRDGNGLVYGNYQLVETASGSYRVWTENITGMNMQLMFYIRYDIAVRILENKWYMQPLESEFVDGDGTEKQIVING